MKAIIRQWKNLRYIFLNETKRLEERCLCGIIPNYDSVDKQNCRESKDANGYHGDVRKRMEKDEISMVG